MDKTLLITGFRSRHDLRFFAKRLNTSVFLHSSRQQIGSKSAKNTVIYRGFGIVTGKTLRKNCINANVSASRSGQNTAIYIFCSVPCLPRFLDATATATATTATAATAATTAATATTTAATTTTNYYYYYHYYYY